MAQKATPPAWLALKAPGRRAKPPPPKTLQEAKAVAAEISPREVLPERVVVTALPAPRIADPAPAPALASPPALALPKALHPGETPCSPTPPPAAPRPPAPSSVEPLAADLRRLHVTVSKRFMQKLEAARDALSHSHPGADVETLLEAGLDLLLDRAAKRRGLVKKPRAQQPRPEDAESADPRQVPAAVSRAVFLRDEGRCQWQMADGGLCGSTHRVELDHVLPVGRGGKPTVENLRILCGPHNDLAARHAYGNDWMNLFTRRGARPASHTAQAP